MRRFDGEALKGAIKKDILRRLRDSDEAMLPKAVQIAQKYSMGTVTTAMMRTKAFGPHPFAVNRWGAPLINPLVINFQGGLFYRSWKPMPGPGIPTIWNTAPYASFLEEGTRKMFARHIEQKIYPELNKKRIQAYDKALQRP